MLNPTTRHSTIYTRTGDAGVSSLFNGERRSKQDPAFQALGTIDELNSHLGVAKEYCLLVKIDELTRLVPFLEEIQSRLLDLGSHIATPIKRSAARQIERVKFPVDALPILEKKIDQLDAQLPKLTQFILPGGGLPASYLHVCRTVCRRAERLTVILLQDGQIDEDPFKYLNRLSDFLFVCARYVCLVTKQAEVSYKKSNTGN